MQAVREKGIKNAPQGSGPVSLVSVARLYCGVAPWEEQVWRQGGGREKPRETGHAMLTPMSIRYPNVS